jgi:hypothetical protein
MVETVANSFLRGLPGGFSSAGLRKRAHASTVRHAFSADSVRFAMRGIVP